MGGESLTFDGDDDAWVFINGRLAVDMGCMHTTYKTTITLDEATAKQLNIYPGGIYDIKMFHAERCSGDNTEKLGSTFQFTLTGFVNSGKADCNTVCGDGLVRGSEECDPIAFADPANPTSDELEQAKIKGCVACKQVPYCGNGVLEKGEQCDNTESWCAECKLADSTCGNGKKEGHEECDDKDGVTGDQICLENCRLSGCGDGVVLGKEECDDGQLEHNTHNQRK